MRKKNNSSLKFSLFFISPAILALIISISMFVYVFKQFQESILKSINDQNVFLTNQVKETTNFADSVLLDLANQVFYDQQVTQLRTEKQLSNLEQIDGIRNINSITATNNMIDSIYVYNGNLDYVFSTSQYGAVNDEAAKFKDTVAVEMFKSRLQENRLVLIPRKSYTAKGYSNSDIYSFMYFENLQDGTSNDNGLMLNLRSTTFSKLYLGGNPDARACIINDRGELISDKRMINEQDLDIVISKVMDQTSKGINSGNFSFEDSEKKDSICFFSNMENHNWVFIKILTNEELFGQIIRARKITTTILSIIITGLIFIFIFVTRSAYIPFFKITSRLNHSKKTTQVLKDLDSLIEESNNSENITLKVKESFLKDLLNGAVSVQNNDIELEKYKLSLAIDFPVVIYLISVPGLSSQLDSIQKIVPYTEIIDFNEKYSVMIYQPTSNEQLKNTTELLRNNYPDSYHITCEEIIDWDLIPFFYNMILDRWNLRFLNPSEKFISAVKEKSHSMASLSEKSALVISNLKRGCLSKVQNAYYDFIKDLSVKNYTTVKIALINLGNAVIKMRYEQDKGRIDAECYHYLSIIESLEDIAVLNDFFESSFKIIAEEQQKKSHQKQDNSIQAILSYIEDNYNNPQLSTKLLASYFEMSGPYLARVFKKHEGISIQGLINKVRIEQAKLLLQNENIKISDVTEKVGIQNRQYFFKLFKTLTGQTPAAYRSEYMHDKANNL